MSTPNFPNASDSFHRLNPNLLGGRVELATQERRAGKPLGPPVDRERDLHNEIHAHCRAHGWVALHGSMAAATHRTAGEPDFVIVMPGKVLFVECKAKGGKLTPAQAAMKFHLETLNANYLLACSMADFLNAVKP